MTDIPETKPADTFDPMDVLSDAATQQLSEAQSTDEGAAPAPVDTPTTSQQGGTAVESAPAAHPAGEDAPPTIQKRDDGKYQLANFVADTPEELSVKILAAQREAQADLTRRQQQDNRADDLSLAAAAADEEEISDEEWTQFEVWRAQQAQAGNGQQAGQIDPLTYAHALRQIDQLTRDPNATDATYQAAATIALQVGDGAKLNEVLNTWGAVNPYAAVNFRTQLEAAQAQAQQVFEQQQQQTVAQQEEQVTAAKARAQEVAAAAYYQQNPDYAQIDAVVRGLIEQRPWLVPAATEQAVRAQDATPLLQTYNDLAAQARYLIQTQQVQGVQQPVAQPFAPAAPVQQQVAPQLVPGPHGQWYQAPPTQEQVMQQQHAAITQEKVDAQVSTGSASDVDVQTRLSNSQGHAEQDKKELIDLIGVVSR